MKEYTVDLSLPPSKRWRGMFSDKNIVKQARQLCQNANDEIIKQFGVFAAWMIKKAMHGTFKLIHDKNIDCYDDMRVWNDMAIGDIGLTIMGNLSYELSQISNPAHPSACTSAAVKTKHGMVHVRNLDWDVNGLKEATIVIDYKNGDKPFKSVTFPGYVGVLSGIAKGRFSASINQAPTSEGPNPFGWSAALLLRHVFENSDSFGEAVGFMRVTKSIYPFFIQIAGIDNAAIIHVMPFSENKVFMMNDKPLCLSNHSPSDKKYYDVEWEEDGETYCTDSIDRLEAIKESTLKKHNTLGGHLNMLKSCSNELTCQSMVFHPQSGEYVLQRSY